MTKPITECIAKPKVKNSLKFFPGGFEYKKQVVKADKDEKKNVKDIRWITRSILKTTTDFFIK